MSDQLNFKQVPFDTMYYNNPTKHAGQVLIDCDPNRTVLKIIESCITKNNTVLSDAELAQWIFRYYICRTNNHVERVKLFATAFKECFEFGGYYERFIAKVQNHDYDKFSGNEHVASYALNCPLYTYPDLYDISPEAKRVYEEIEWPKHYQLNDHHPEHYMRCVDEENNAWAISDDEMEEFFKDKGGHPAALMALGEMVADWMAVGSEKDNTARSWWLENQNVKWSYGPRYTQCIEMFLGFEPSKLYVEDVTPIPQPPDLKNEDSVMYCPGTPESTQSESLNPSVYCDKNSSNDVGVEKLFIHDEQLLHAVRSAMLVNSLDKLYEMLKPGDLLMIYRKDGILPRAGQMFNEISTKMSGSSFSSIKIIGQNKAELYGYGSVVGYTGFKKTYTKQFLSTIAGCIVLRNPALKKDQLDRIFRYLEERVDRIPYDVAGIIRSVITHIFGTKDRELTQEELNQLQPLFCSSIFAYAFKAAGVDPELEFKDYSTVWPKDFAIHSAWKPVYSYFIRAEEADVVLEQQEPSAASYLPEVSTEGWFDPVAEEGMHYTIRNFPVLQFFNKLRKEYKTTKLEHLFEVIGIRLFSANRRTIVIHKFFIPELLYLLDKFAFPISLINTIKAHTWVSDPAPRGMIFGGADLSFIEKTMTAELYPHQKEFIQNYQVNKKMNHLRGALLSFEQGLGKTITALALMQGLKKEHVVIVCPKNTMLETWNHHLIKFFKEPQKTWIINTTKGPLTSRYKWIIVNYEQLEYVKEFLMKNKLPNLGIIVDESHNFLRTSSVRTQLLVDLSKYNSDADILLLSGTPVKCAGVDLIPMMSVLDPFFDEEAITIFKKTFGFNTAIANDVLNARLSRMMTRVTKVILDLPEKKESVVSVRMDTGWKYTASQVEKQIITFVKERQEYYNQNLHLYINAFEEVIEWLKGEPDISSQPEFQRYLSIIDYLRDANISDARGNADIVWANQYEINVLIPALPDNLKKQFVWSKSVVKYLPLKIKGEVIGQLLTRLRIQMTSEMMQAADLKQYVDKAMKKTIVFTSYVDTIELAYNYFKSNDYNPIAIYGKTASELTANVERFQTDQSLNPLIASLKMLSTGATLTAANTVIFLNKPWRSIEYQQASDRIHRIGQDTPCEIISLVLDTGKEANLSTRMEDIMQWSGDQFDQIVDKKEREMMKKFFRGFESLDIPEDCEVSMEAGAEPVVVPNPGTVFYATGNRLKRYIRPQPDGVILVAKSRDHAILSYCRSAIQKLKQTTSGLLQCNYDEAKVYGGGNKVTVPCKWGGSKNDPFIRKTEEKRDVFVYEFDTTDCKGEFTAEAVEHGHILRYEGEARDLPITKAKEYAAVDIQVTFKVVDDLESTENLSLESLSSNQLVLKELDPSNLTEIKYVTDVADLINDSVDYEKWTPEDVYRDLKLGRQFFLLMSGSVVVGSIGMMIYEDNTVDLYNFGIFPKYQGKGYGQQALMSVVQYVNNQNPQTTEIYIQVHKTNQKAQHIYESMGFKIVETREETYLMVLKNKPSKEDLPSEGNESNTHVYLSTESMSSDSDLKLHHRLVKHFGPAKSEESSSYEEIQYQHRAWSESDIKSIDDLNRFYAHVEYTVLDPKTGKPKYGYISPKDAYEQHRMLSISDILKYEIGQCQDTTHLSSYFLTKWNIKHTCISIKSNDDVPTSDKNPGHITLVYKDKSNKWRWLEGTFQPYMNNTLVFDTEERAIQTICKIFANTTAKSMKACRFTKFPPTNTPIDKEQAYFNTNDIVCVEVPNVHIQPMMSTETQQTSAPSKIAQKKKKILDYICKLCDTMEPSGLNSKRYRQIIGQMNDKEFDQFMNYMKEGKWQLHIVAPNMIVNLQNEDLLKACDLIGLKLFHKVWMYDKVTGRKYLTDNEYMFVKLPVRRQQQFLDEKISVPDNDRSIDGLTGQVTGDSRSCAITNPEIHILAARGLDKTLQELVNVRGGNVHGYNEFRRMLEETGEADLDALDPNSKTRVSVVGKVLLQSMMIDTNL